MYPKRGLFIIAIILPLFGCNSQTVHAGTAPVTRNLELEAFKEVVSWPNSTLPSKTLLLEQFLASRRYEEAYLYFQKRAKQQPDVPLFLALEGLFQAKMAPDVNLFKRIGWVKEAIAKLDLAVSRDPGLSRYFRGLVLAELPSFPFSKTDDALVDLEWFFQNKEKFPFGLRRNAYLALAKVYTTRGEAEKAKTAFDKSGYTSLDSESARFDTDAWITAKGGYRFSEHALIEAAPKVYVVRGDDFADFAFVETADSIVAIDAGATNERAGNALSALRRITTKPLSHLIFTHAHWDHVGGVDAFLKANPGLEIIAQGHFSEELKLMNTSGVRFQYFFGRDQRQSYEAKPNRLISKRESLLVGGTEFVLYPVRGGETHDALLIHMPAKGIVFMGDTMMPYIGAPFLNEGSAEGLQETIALVRSLKPKLLIHGHTPLTINWTIEAFAGLDPAMGELYQRTVDGIQNGKTLVEILHQNIIPPVLRTEPSAVVPYLVMRDNYIKRLYEQKTGYWKFDGEGIERFSPSEIASALDLLGGGREQAFVNAVKSLYAGSDFALALRLENYGLLKYPKSAELSQLRRQTLGMLQEKNQQINPFKFIIYSEQAGSELPLIPQ